MASLYILTRILAKKNWQTLRGLRFLISIFSLETLISNYIMSDDVTVPDNGTEIENHLFLDGFKVDRVVVGGINLDNHLDIN